MPDSTLASARSAAARGAAIRCRRRRYATGGFALLALAGALVCLAPVARAEKRPPPVVVDVAPERVEYRTYPRGQPPPGVLSFANEHVAGCCETRFSRDCWMTYSTPRLSLKRRMATIESVRIYAELTVTIWTEEGSLPDVMEHEEAHRTIARHYYALTEAVARDLAREYVGRKVPASPPDASGEAPPAVTGLQDEILARLAAATSDRNDVAQAKFDAYTYGRPNSAIPEAMKRALEEEAAEYAAATQRRDG